VRVSSLDCVQPCGGRVEVHCHPSQIPDYVKRFAVQRGNGHIVTDEHQDELRNVAPLASVFIEVNAEAPEGNARIMASEYGLSCPNMENEDEPIRESLPDDARPDPRFMAITAELSAGSGKAPLPRIAICARPEGIWANEWHGGNEWSEPTRLFW
jgi:hypothetical protein